MPPLTMTALPLLALAFVGLVVARRRKPSKGDEPEEDLVEWAMRASAEPPKPTRRIITEPAQRASSWLLTAIGNTIGQALIDPSLRMADTVSQRLDSISNILTGLGTTSDKGQAGRPNTKRKPLSARELDALYRFNGYAARFVDIVPDNATRKGWTVTSDDSDDGVDVMKDENKRLGITGKVADAHRWGRLYGGAALFLVTDDAATMGDDPGALAQPLNLDTVERVRNIIVLDGNEVQPLNYETDPNKAGFREPVTWLITPSGRGVLGSMVSREVHTSRIIYFPGRKLSPSQRFTTNTGLDESVLEAAWDPVRNLTVTDQGAAILANELKIDTLKVSGLANLATSDEQEEFFDMRLRNMIKAQSLLNMRVLDSGEEYTSEAANVTGYRDLADGLRTALSAVTAIPQTILFGEAPGGLNSDGDSSRKIWDKVIAVVQTIYLLPRLERLYKVLFAAKQGPTNGTVPDSWSVGFNPLDEPTETEQATIRKTNAETDAIYIGSQVLTPEHVAASRFSEKGYQSELLPVDVDDDDDDFVALERARALLASEGKPVDEGEDEPVDEGEDVPDETAPDKPGAPVEDVQKTALNGAQVTAAAELVKAVVNGELPRDAVLGQLQVFFNLSSAQAADVLGTVGQGFKPDSPAPDDGGE